MITIYGASDDLVEVEGCEDADEFDVYGEGRLLWRGDFVAPGSHARQQMRVYGIYDGCWHFSAGQVDESVPLPTWPLTIRQGTAPEHAEYTTVLAIDAPVGVRLTNVWPECES